MSTEAEQSTAPARTEGSGRERVLIVGGGSGIALALARDLLDDGAEVWLGTRAPDRLRDRLSSPLREEVRLVHVDLSEEATIAALAELGGWDHVVSLAADHANGPLDGLEGEDIRHAFDAKVVGPLLLAKHLGSAMPAGGSFVLFSGVAAWRPSPGLTVMATTNGAVAFLVAALAVELAPVRAVAVSPGIIDSGAWDGMGETDRDAFFARTAQANPVGRVGTVEDVVATVRHAMSAGFVTGTTLHVDGGGSLG